MASENGGNANSAMMWRVGDVMSARIRAAKPKLEAALGGLKLNQTQVIDYLLGKGLEATGLGDVQPEPEQPSPAADDPLERR